MANEKGKETKGENEKIKKWFKENEKFFTISVWEDEIGAPRGTLTRFINGERGLVLSHCFKLAFDICYNRYF